MLYFSKCFRYKKSMMSQPLKKDIYSANRGGYSEILRLSCLKCGTYSMHYQKDGPGDLKRIYVDRMFDTKLCRNFQPDDKLFCPTCGRMLAMGYLYPKEKRPAYALFQGTVAYHPVSFKRHFICWIKGLILLCKKGCR